MQSERELLTTKEDAKTKICSTFLYIRNDPQISNVAVLFQWAMFFIVLIF